MVSLTELVGSSFLYFLLVTLVLAALWSYVIYAKGSAQPTRIGALVKEEPVSAKRGTKTRSKSKRDGTEENCENKQKTAYVTDKPKINETVGIHSVVLRDTQTHRKPKKAKRKSNSKLEEPNTEAPAVNDSFDVEGGWKVQLSRQQLRVLREQQRQKEKHEQSSQAEQCSSMMTTAALIEQQPISSGINLSTEGKASDVILDQSRDSDSIDIERALKEAADASSSECIEKDCTPDNQNEVEIAVKDIPIPTTATDSEHSHEEEWVIL